MKCLVLLQAITTFLAFYLGTFRYLNCHLSRDLCLPEKRVLFRSSEMITDYNVK